MTIITRIRHWLLRTIAGREPVALNLKIGMDGYNIVISDPDAPALVCDNTFDRRGPLRAHIRVGELYPRDPYEWMDPFS